MQRTKGEGHNRSMSWSAQVIYAKFPPTRSPDRIKPGPSKGEKSLQSPTPRPEFLTYIAAPLVQIRMESLIIGIEKCSAPRAVASANPNEVTPAAARDADSEGDRLW